MQIYKYGPIEPRKPPKPSEDFTKVIGENLAKIDLKRILDDYIVFLVEVENDSSLVNNKEFTDYLKATLKSLKASRFLLK